MTAIEEEFHHLTEPAPIPIKGEVDITAIHGSLLTHAAAADFGAYFSIVFVGTETPLQVLPYDVNRSKAYITCTGTGPVYVGTIAGVTAMKGGQTTGQTPAFILTNGVTLTVGHKQAVYISPDGSHSATVSVSVERWES